MRYVSFGSVLAMVCGFAAAVEAEDHASIKVINAMGRWSGYGWSHGYHTQDDCQNCEGNRSVITTERYFDSVLPAESVEHPQPLPVLLPAVNEPGVKPSSPPPKATSSLNNKVKADDARNSRHPAFPLRANRYPLQQSSR